MDKKKKKKKTYISEIASVFDPRLFFRTRIVILARTGVTFVPQDSEAWKYHSRGRSATSFLIDL